MNFIAGGDIQPQIEEFEANPESTAEVTLIPVQINRNAGNSALGSNGEGVTSPRPSSRLSSASPINQDTLGSIMRMLNENDFSNFDVNLDELAV